MPIYRVQVLRQSFIEYDVETASVDEAEETALEFAEDDYGQAEYSVQSAVPLKFITITP